MAKAFLKADRIKFEKEIAEVLNTFSTFTTQYGLYHVSRFEAKDNLLSIFGRFTSTERLPKPGNPYGGEIYGWSVNGYSGKWNFHFGKGWTVEGAVQEFKNALEYIGVNFEERNKIIEELKAKAG
jgi:hypothetical protein